MLHWYTRQLSPPFQELHPVSLEQGATNQESNRPMSVQHGFRTINFTLFQISLLLLCGFLDYHSLWISQYNLTISQMLDPITSVIILDCFILFWNWNDGKLLQPSLPDRQCLVTESRLPLLANTSNPRTFVSTFHMSSPKDTVHFLYLSYMSSFSTPWTSLKSLLYC